MARYIDADALQAQLERKRQALLTKDIQRVGTTA